MSNRKAIPTGWNSPIQEFKITLLASGHSLASVRLREGWIRRFARAVGADPWQVETCDFLSWSASKGWSQNTRRSAHQSIHHFYSWANQTGRCSRPPTIPLIKKAEPAPHPADDRSIKVALESGDPRVILAVRLACELGLRRGECARGHSRDIIEDLTGHSLIVHGKGGKQRIIPLTTSLSKALRALPPGYFFPGDDGGHISAAWLGRLVGRALPPGVTMHALRHRFTTRSYERTHDLVSIQKILGHASPSTTLHYLKIADESLRRVVEAAA